MAEDATSSQNLTRQVGLYAQAIINTNPVPTTTASPQAYGFSLNTTATTVLASVANNRRGLVFHAPSTFTVYVYPGTLTTTPTPSAPAGSFIIYGGGTLTLAPNNFPNMNTTWSAFGATGTTSPLTIVEFF